jgi:hypothetical protein
VAVQVQAVVLLAEQAVVEVAEEAEAVAEVEVEDVDDCVSLVCLSGLFIRNSSTCRTYAHSYIHFPDTDYQRIPNRSSDSNAIIVPSPKAGLTVLAHVP